MSGRHTAAVRAFAATVLLLVAAGLASVLVLVDRSHGSRAAPTSRPVVVPAQVPVRATAPAPPVPEPSIIATLSAATPYSAVAGGPAVGTLPAANPFGGPEVLAVTESVGEGAAAWLHVELPIRPNGSSGWIPAAKAALTQTGYRIAVSLSARTLTVTDAGRQVLTTPVAVGKSSTPTPPGRTYLWELIRPDDPTGPYGPYIFGLAEYSDAYSVFNGGDAQIGIHGQDEPWSIGYAASNGCVRLPNTVITRLAGMLPLGTPVDIS